MVFLTPRFLNTSSYQNNYSEITDTASDTHKYGDAVYVSFTAKQKSNNSNSNPKPKKNKAVMEALNTKPQSKGSFSRTSGSGSYLSYY